MSEQKDLPDFLKPISKFCNIYEKLDTGEYVISHSWLRHVRCVVDTRSDKNITVSTYHHDYKLIISYDKIMVYLHDRVVQAIDENLNTVIDNIERYHVRNTGVKVKPLGITKTKVKKLSNVYGEPESGMCSIKLSITVYDNWWLYKHVRYTNNVVIGLSKNEIYATVCDENKDACGVCDDIHNVDSLISELISMQTK